MFRAVRTPKLVRGCQPNNSTSTVARGMSNLGATAHAATLQGASATVHGSPKTQETPASGFGPARVSLPISTKELSGSCSQQSV